MCVQLIAGEKVVQEGFSIFALQPPWCERVTAKKEMLMCGCREGRKGEGRRRGVEIE